MTSDRREPLFNIPAVLLVLLAVMAAIQLWQGTLSLTAKETLISRFAFVPGRMTFALDPVGVVQRVAAWGASNDPSERRKMALASLFLGRGGVDLWSLVSYAFLHGGWTHLGLNGLWMIAFGTPVARRFGTFRFLVFMAVAAIWGAIAHWICFPFGFIPVVGASAAVSGLMGAALRFMFCSIRTVEDQRTVPPLSLIDVFRNRRALSFIAVWFVTNSLFGAGSVAFGLTDAPVAWQAHVGGFVAGLVLFPWFDPAPPPVLDVWPSEASSPPEGPISPVDVGHVPTERLPH